MYDDLERIACVEVRVAHGRHVLIVQLLAEDRILGREQEELGIDVARRLGQYVAGVVERSLVAEAADEIVEAHRVVGARERTDDGKHGAELVAGESQHFNNFTELFF